MKRKMLFTERLMYVDGKTPVNCILTARLAGSIAIRSLLSAINKVQAKHPLLRVSITDEHGHPHFFFEENPPPIPLRIVERHGDADWQSITLQEWKTIFHLKAGPPFRVVWIRSEDVSELLLVGHHCVCDGASLITILREIMQLIDQPEAQLTAYPPFQSLADLIPEEIFSDPKIALRARAKAALLKLFALTIRHTDVIPDPSHYLIYWRASAKETSALASRCKAEDTTPYAALCVAFMMAFRQLGSRKFKNKVICPVNIRRFVTSLRADVMFNYAPTISLSIGEDPQEGFWSMAKKLKQSMSQKIERLKVYEELIGAEYLQGSISKLISLLLKSKGSYDFAFSNVGRIDISENYQAFRVESILGATVAVPWRNATTLVTTHFRGQTDVAFVSNDSFLPYIEAAAIKERAISLLSEAIQT
jgi:hypothetical protein